MRASLLTTLSVIPSLVLAGCSERPNGSEAYEAANAAGPVESAERYDGHEVSPVHQVAADPVSTFAVDVDTGAYANVCRMLLGGQTVPADAVWTEEMINYFRYDYPLPDDRAVPFSVITDIATIWKATRSPALIWRTSCCSPSRWRAGGGRCSSSSREGRIS